MMSSDLIFHVVSKRKWRDRNKGGYYTTEESSSESNDVECVTSHYLNEYLNSRFRGRKNLLLLVIDKSRLVNPIKKEDENNVLWVIDGINIDAILDKIRLDCDTEGKFDLMVTSGE